MIRILYLVSHNIHLDGSTHHYEPCGILHIADATGEYNVIVHYKNNKPFFMFKGVRYDLQNVGSQLTPRFVLKEM